MRFRPEIKLLLLSILLLPILTNADNLNTNIHFNQLGFNTLGPKVALLPDVPQIRFSLVDKRTNEEVYSGPLGQAKEWKYAGAKYKLADFSDFETPGTYAVKLEGLAPSREFEIGKQQYSNALQGAVKALYYNRASAALEERHAGIYKRPAAHPDTIVYVHRSAASHWRPEGTTISSPKGWYDAGDYNKYIVPSNITVYTLLQAFADHPTTFSTMDLNIPESHNALPDLIDEVLWNIEWMLSMQDPVDGGVYHKLTTKRFTRADLMPHTQYQPRYVVAKSSPAAFGFAASMAHAARQLRPFQKQLPGLDSKLERAAVSAWEWALQNPTLNYKQPKDIETGEYAPESEAAKDDKLWAAAELFALTKDKKYLKHVKLPNHFKSPSWFNVGTLGALTLAESPQTPKKLKNTILNQLKSAADEWATTWQNSAIGVPQTKNNLRWGSNGYLMNKAFTLLRINKVAPNKSYVLAARGSMDYILGKNPLGYSFLTGHGSKTPMHIHHRASNADGIADPIPGWLAGGPNFEQQDKENCEREGAKYQSDLPALAYIDHFCSFASNEVTIYWNASLIYVLAAFQD